MHMGVACCGCCLVHGAWHVNYVCTLQLARSYMAYMRRCAGESYAKPSNHGKGGYHGWKVPHQVAHLAVWRPSWSLSITMGMTRVAD